MWRRYFLAKMKSTEPIKVYPDSTKSYSLEGILKIIEKIEGGDILKRIDDPNEKKFVEILREIEKVRKEHPKTEHAEEIQFEKLEEMASKLKNHSLDTHDRNRIMNLILESNEEYKVRKNVKHRISDVILYILFAQSSYPIHGRITITKQVFLTIKEVLGEENVENPKFVPYRYGPYSFLVTHVISNLEYDGLLDIKGRKNTSSEKFILTEKGIKVAKKKFTRLPRKLQNELIDKRIGWDQSHVRGILAYVYNKYPEYTEKSLLKKKYQSIIWGRARG